MSAGTGILGESTFPFCAPFCSSPVDVVETDGGRVALFPQRPEAPVCEFYMKTGHCRWAGEIWHSRVWLGSGRMSCRQHQGI